MGLDDQTQLSQIIHYLQKAVKKLSPKQQVIFDLRHSQHKKIKEIAEIMKCSESNVKTQLFRSVARLKKELIPVWREQ